jgi:hypothetical protein
MKFTAILVRCLYVLFLAGCVSTSPEVSAGSSAIGRVIKQPGTFQPAHGKCKAMITVSEVGGFKQLTITRVADQNSKDRLEVKDVSGITWIAGDQLVYTVSPIYGKPGVFLFDCASLQAKRILGPKTTDKSYPDGADYFELQGVSSDAKKIIFFYAPNVDQVDFKKFRTKDSLYQINLDGTSFRKAE